MRAIAETLSKTTLGEWHEGRRVNLERAVRAMDRLGGHIVQGHIDAVGTVTDIITNDAGCEMWIKYEASFRKYLAPVGSICVDGVSLTVADISGPAFKVALIPHTLSNTTLGITKVGQLVNLEFDALAKYVEQLLPQLPSAE